MKETQSRPVLSLVLAHLWIVVGHFLVFQHLKPLGTDDPDRYYHLALARMTAESGLLRQLPQVPALGWDTSFVDKNFLFTAISGVFHWFGGEQAVLWMIPILGIGILLVIFHIARLAVPIWFAAFVATFPFWVSPIQMARLMMLRPHMLAMLIFLLMVYAILRRHLVFAAVAGVAFGLAYQAYYVLLALLLTALVLGWKELPLRKAVAGGLIGLFVGLIINPYFPSNVDIGISTFKIATNTGGIDEIDRPVEILSLRADRFLKYFHYPLLLLFLVLFSVSKILPLRNLLERSGDRKKTDLLLVLLMAILFWVLTAITTRAQEYAHPLTVLTVPLLIALVRNKRLFQGAFAAFTLIFPAYIAAKSYFPKPTITEVPKYILESAQHLPDHPEQKLVFNCEWWTSPLILYTRPQLQFVDLSDPVLLWERAPKLHQLRQEFRGGKIAYPYNFLKYAFNADYVFCANSNVKEQLERDPHFRRLFPAQATRQNRIHTGFPFLYALTEKPNRHLIDEYEGYLFEGTDVDSFYEANPGRIRNWQRIELGVKFKVPYVDLFHWRLEQAQSRGLATTAGRDERIYCVGVRPTKEQMKRHRGADFVGIGGGRKVRLWFNGKPLFSTRKGYALGRWLHTLVPLPHPLRATDRIEAIVCSSDKALYMGYAASFWKKHDVENTLCHTEATRNSLPWRSNEPWPTSGESHKRCGVSIASQISS